MNIARTFNGYSEFARKLAAEAGLRVDAFLAPNTRRVRTESSDLFLGGDAWPGALAYARVGVRR
jgi:hypothetical protein